MVNRNVIVSVENPSSSYLWLVMYHFCKHNEVLMSMWLALEQVHFQACMHGSDPDKRTCWYPTPKVFSCITARCDGGHVHKSWRPSLDQSGRPIFSTASEAAYPEQLCVAATRAVVDECTRRGVLFHAEAFRPTPHAENQLISSKRGHKALPPLVAEYLCITDEQPKDCDFKVVGRVPFEVKRGDVDNKSSWEESEWQEFRVSKGAELKISKQGAKKLYAVNRTPKQFVHSALSCKHPLIMLSHYQISCCWQWHVW